MNEENLFTEMRHLPFVHSTNLGQEKLVALDLLNKVYFKNAFQMYVFA